MKKVYSYNLGAHTGLAWPPVEAATADCKSYANQQCIDRHIQTSASMYG